jgi:hypothetical protein
MNVAKKIVEPAPVVHVAFDGAPVLSLFDVYTFRYSFVADYYQYLVDPEGSS